MLQAGVQRCSEETKLDESPRRTNTYEISIKSLLTTVKAAYCIYTAYDDSSLRVQIPNLTTLTAKFSPLIRQLGLSRLTAGIDSLELNSRVFMTHPEPGVAELRFCVSRARESTSDGAALSDRAPCGGFAVCPQR